MGLQPNLDRFCSPLVAQQFDFLIHKTSKGLNRVEKRFKLELNSWSPFVGWFVFRKLRLNRTLGDQLLRYPPRSFFSDFLYSFGWACDTVKSPRGVVPRGTPKADATDRLRRIGLKQNPRPKESCLGA